MYLHKFYYDYASIVYADSQHIVYRISLDKMQTFYLWNN